MFIREEPGTWEYYNPNPKNNRVGDCVVRAICKVLGHDWHKIYLGIVAEGCSMADMPSANHVWGAYLRKHGYERNAVKNDCPDCYTVTDFCIDNPEGRYILALNNHVVAAVDGIYYDTWDSGNEVVNYYWERKE